MVLTADTHSPALRLSKICSATINLHQLYFELAYIHIFKTPIEENPLWEYKQLYLLPVSASQAATALYKQVYNSVLLVRGVAECMPCCLLSLMEV
jgi:hypothetical protein